jgi:predicted ATP-grasp superfamily ATP-dependent carboligase
MSNWTAERPHTLNIVGASVRAAVASARAASFDTWCADRFGDVDLQVFGPSMLVGDYPRGLIGALHDAPRAHWLYTGALENHSALVEELAAMRPLLGNRGDSLRRARDPVYWTSALADSNLPRARVAVSAETVPRDSEWLVKPLHSAGGTGVRPFRAKSPADVHAHDDRPRFYQQFISGVPLSAVYVATDGEVVLLGVTKQLLGRSCQEALNGTTEMDRRPRTDFHYAGSIGPLVLSDRLFQQAVKIGGVLAAACDLVGLLGVDLVLAEDNLWTVEINPRYTASIEVLERASALRTVGRRTSRLLCIQAHVDACMRGILPQPIGQSGEICTGKLIVYAERETLFGDAAARFVAQRNLAPGPPSVADIPAAGSTFAPGQPILTLLADDTSEAAVVEKLRKAATQISALMETSSE